MMSESIARVMDVAEAMDDPPENCAQCGTQLMTNNRAYWIDGGTLCRDCAAHLGGVRVDHSTMILMTKGHLVFCRYPKGAWGLRLEVRTASHVDCVTLRSTFGGGIWRHDRKVWKWSMASQADLSRIAPFIGQYIPELGALIQRYVAQPGPKAKAAFLEAASSIIGRSVTLSDFVAIGE